MFGDFFDPTDIFVGSFGVFSMVILALLGLLFAVAAYVFPCYTLMTVGRKARQQDDWMAFVPFAQDIYRLRIVGAPMWQLCFFGSCGVLAIVLFDLIIVLINAAVLNFIAVLVTFGWIVYRLFVNYSYYQKYYKGFGFNPMMALMLFLPVLAPVMFIIDIIIAYKADIEWQKAPAPFVQNVQIPNPVVGQAPAQPGMGGSISAVSGMYAGAVFQMRDGEELAFGRDPLRCQVIFDDKSPEVSKNHCSVRYQAAGNRYVVTDFSKNGTFTEDNRRLQPNMPVPMPAGSVIFLGSRKNSFRLG